MIQIRRIEERVEPVIGYHGTSDVYLREILKKGMLPNPKNRTWGEDPQASVVQISRTSLEGSYWTTNLMTAISSASNTARKMGGNSIIVIASLIPESGIPDEDEMLFTLKSSLDSAAREEGFMTDSPSTLGILFGGDDTEKILESITSKIAEELHNEWAVNPSEKPIQYELFYDFTKAFFERQAVYSIRGSGERQDWKFGFNRGYMVASGGDDYPGDIPMPEELFGDKQYVEMNLKDAQDALTRYYKDIAASVRKAGIRGGNFRILEPVTYRGRNRIIGIVRIHEGDVSTNYRDDLELVYGEVPDTFKEDYEKRVGTPIWKKSQ